MRTRAGQKEASLLTTNNSDGGPAAWSRRQVTLSRDGPALVAAPRDGRRRRGPKSVPLPRLPLSLAAWLSALATRFRRRRGDCLGVMLMLDVSTRRWVPLLPTQRCGRHWVGWSTRDEDFVDLPPHLWIGGSFQTLASDDPIDAADAVPSFDGVHLLNWRTTSHGRSRAAAWIFVRAAGEVGLADAANVLVDDLADTLRRHAHRLLT